MKRVRYTNWIPGFPWSVLIWRKLGLEGKMKWRLGKCYKYDGSPWLWGYVEHVEAKPSVLRELAKRGRLPLPLKEWTAYWPDTDETLPIELQPYKTGKILDFA